MTTLRLLETIHGHLGVLLAAALLHPAILLRNGRKLSRGMWWSVALTTALAAVAFFSGVVIYDDYRAHVKRQLFADSRAAGLLFETKEHLAWAVLSLSLGAGLAAMLAPRKGRSIRRAAGWTYAVAAILCLVTVALGTWVASVRTFPM